MGMLVTCPQCGSVHYTQSAMECQCDRMVGTFTCDDCVTEFEVTYMAESIRRMEVCWTVTDDYDGSIIVVAKTLQSALRYLVKIGEITGDTLLNYVANKESFYYVSDVGPLEEDDTIQELEILLLDGKIDLGFQFQKMEIWGS